MSLLLTLILAFSIVGCSDNTVSDKQKPQTDTTESNSSETTKPKKEQKKESKKAEKYAHIKGDIEEQLIYNENGITITAKGFDFESSFLEPSLVLHVKNNSGQHLRLESENVAINDYMIHTEMKTEIPDGQDADAKIRFIDSTLFDERIKNIEKIAFTIDMLNISSLATAFKTEEIVLETNLKAEEYPEIQNGQTVFDKGGIKIVYLDMIERDINNNAQLYFYIENGLDEVIHIHTREAIVNGEKIDVIFTPVIQPKRRYIENLEIEENDLRDEKIYKIENIVTKLRIINDETYETYFKDEEISIDNLQETIQITEKEN